VTGEQQRHPETDQEERQGGTGGGAGHGGAGYHRGCGILLETDSAEADPSNRRGET
jgi:hypothetical protein